ncbi:MAG: Lrp/AsnC family transcriptional regulator [Thermoproteota archaeon]|nr:MAG: Lrp/AsnC family transcriptional regulator [Candidatus Korarchaeota archaeon]
MKLDSKDIEILKILQENCRLTAKKISNKLGIPISTVYAKIKRMEQSKIILGYKAVLNASKLGMGTTAFILASVAYRVPGIEEPLSQVEIAKKIALFPEVQEVHIISGDWDLMIKVKARDVHEIGEFVVNKLRKVKGIEKTLTCMVFKTAKETTEIPVFPKNTLS